MACIPLKKYLKENEDMAYDLNGYNSWKKMAADYLEEMFSGFSFEGTKLHEELTTLIYHLFKSNPLKFNERENMYAYEFEYGTRTYRYYSNGLVVRYAGRSNLYNLIDDGSFIDQYSTVLNSYELPEKIKKEIKIKAKEAEIKAREELDKKVQTAAKRSVTTTKRKKNPLVIPSFLENLAKWTLAYYQGAKWSDCKGYSKIPKVTKYPIYKIIERLRLINDKLNHPIKVKATEKDRYLLSLYRNYNIVETIRNVIDKTIEKEMKPLGITYGHISNVVDDTPLQKLFKHWFLDSAPVNPFREYRSEEIFKSWVADGVYNDYPYNDGEKINEAAQQKLSEYLRTEEDENNENEYYYNDINFCYDVGKHAGKIIKMVPDKELFVFLAAYDEYVKHVKTLPFGEEWMIRNTIIPPLTETDKKGK